MNQSTSDISLPCNDSENVSFDKDLTKETVNKCNDAIPNQTWNICENWHVLIGSSTVTVNDCSEEKPRSNSKPRTNPSYLDNCAEWDYIKNSKLHNLPLFVNSNKCKPIKQGHSLLNIQKTCAFDSIMQVVMSAIAANETYRNETKSFSDPIFRLANSILTDGKLTVKHYDKRACILQDIPIFSDAIATYTRGIRRLNANCNAAHLAEYIFKSAPSCIFQKSCTCQHTHTRQTITCCVNINILWQEGLHHIQRAINDVQEL